jgi:hypothetical protein
VNHAVQLVGPNGALWIFGLELAGVNGENGKKLLFSVIFLLVFERREHDANGRG